MLKLLFEAANQGTSGGVPEPEIREERERETGHRETELRGESQRPPGSSGIPVFEHGSKVEPVVRGNQELDVDRVRAELILDCQRVRAVILKIHQTVYSSPVCSDSTATPAAITNAHSAPQYRGQVLQKKQSQRISITALPRFFQLR